MCIVTCIINNNKVLLTSNRDIPPTREHSHPPKVYNKNGITILMPYDPKGLGSWIGTTSSHIVCILNHTGKNDALKSRGELLVNLLSNKMSINRANKECNNYNSFKMIYIDKINQNYYKIIWNGKDFTISKINQNINIWLSETVYKKDEINSKKDIFLRKYNSSSSSQDIIKFHLDINNIRDDNLIKTTSLTQISHHDTVNMYYNDLVNNQDYSLKLSL